MISIRLKPTNRTDAFICIRSVSLDDGAYMEVPGHSYPCLADARWWFVVHRLCQLGAYVNPVYTLIWLVLPSRSTPRHCYIPPVVVLCTISVERTFPPVPVNRKPEREFKVGDKI